MIFSLFSFAFASPMSDALRTYDCPRAMNISPPPTEFHFQLAIGHCYAKEGLHNDALKFYRNAPSSFLPYAKLLEAQSLHALSNHEKANEALNDAIEGAEKQLLQAKILIAQGERNRGKKLLNSLLTKKRSQAGYRPSFGDIDPAELRWLLARSAIDQGRIPAAISVLKTIWTHNPTSVYSQKTALLLADLHQR